MCFLRKRKGKMKFDILCLLRHCENSFFYFVKIKHRDNKAMKKLRYNCKNRKLRECNCKNKKKHCDIINSQKARIKTTNCKNKKIERNYKLTVWKDCNKIARIKEENFNNLFTKKHIISILKFCYVYYVWHISNKISRNINK